MLDGKSGLALTICADMFPPFELINAGFATQYIFDVTNAFN
jgi:hypothetical protein